MSNYTEEEAMVIAGAVSGYLGHNNFKITNIEEIDCKPKKEDKAANNGFMNLFGLFKPKK